MFVGRERELEELEGALSEAAEGRGRLVLVTGEAGIGKTRLAEEQAAAASALGFRTLRGRSWESGGAPEYWPWAQILSTLRARGAGDERVAERLARIDLVLDEVLPSAPTGFGSVASGLGTDTARFLFFEEVAACLREVARATPLLLVLDDLHAADHSTVLLLRFLAPELREMRILALGTYQDTGPYRLPELRGILGDVARHALYVALGGISVGDVQQLVEHTFGASPSKELATRLHMATKGNPFFLTQMIRVMAGRGLQGAEAAELPLTYDVRQMLRRRLDSVSNDCREVLGVAAVMGDRFDSALLATISGLPRQRLERLLGEAMAHRLVSPDAEETDRHVFEHTLIRETIYEDLPMERRVAVHRLAGEALELLHSTDLHPHAATLAHHFGQAAAAGTEALKAIRYSLTAGTRAMERLAYEEAETHFRRATYLLRLTPDTDPAELLQALLALAEAQSRTAVPDSGKQTFREVVDLARAIGDVKSFAAAALGIAGPWPGSAKNETVSALLEEALGRTAEAAAPLRARLMSRLAVELYFSSDRERMQTLSREAVELSRRSGDAATIASALIHRHFVASGPEGLAERLDLGREMIELAERLGDRELLLEGRFWRISDLLEAGDVVACDRDLADVLPTVHEIKLPRYLWYAGLVRTTRAFLDGNFAEGERLAESTHDVGSRLQEQAGLYLATSISLARSEQGRLAELEWPIRTLAAEYPWFPALRCELAYLSAEIGSTSEARAEIQALSASRFEALPRDALWLRSVVLLALAARKAGDVAAAEQLYGALVPFAEMNVCTGAGGVSLGSASRYLGVLATTVGRFADAARHFAVALAANRRMGAMPWVAHTQRDWAEMLLERRESGDERTASGLLASALDIARDLGMKALERKIRETGLRQPVNGATVRSDAATAVFRNAGTHWEIGVGGRIHRFRDAKGIRYVAHLLAHPDEPIDVTELVRIADGPPASDREKARKAVTNRLRDAVAAIRREDPRLAEHLERTIRTGAVCRYVSAGAFLWSL